MSTGGRELVPSAFQNIDCTKSLLRISRIACHLSTEPRQSCRSIDTAAESSLQLSDQRDAYKHFLSIQTRWMDNDVYGHLNNNIYYSFIDSVVNDFLIRRGGLDIERGAVIGLVVESGCQYRKPLAFPGVVECGLRVAKLGTSSVRYEVGVFGAGADTAAAVGHFVHVFVDRSTRRPAAIPADIRSALGSISAAAD
eukprot:TRINITY_DN14505_c0_g1_i1.p1 TRINITY_DN14505_c0_g1~~TRINITY_DN14505_c0_g1_i1.p1  ORF type:complete len:196 (-),score=9.91 TRINITY_DN14505_c0_g1_i1:136-723(-)